LNHEVGRVHLHHPLQLKEDQPGLCRLFVATLRYRIFASLHLVGDVERGAVCIDRVLKPCLPAHRTPVVGAAKELLVALGAYRMATVEREDRIDYGIFQAHGALREATITVLLLLLGISHSLFHPCAYAGVEQQATRQVPDFFTEEDRTSFLAIGLRATCEEINCYTVVSLGLQAYIANRRIESHAATHSEPADK